MRIIGMKRSGHRGHFVVNGMSRFVDGVRASVKVEVESEFSERIAEANWLRRLVLRRQIRQEVNRRLATEIAKQMPSDATLW